MTKQPRSQDLRRILGNLLQGDVKDKVRPGPRSVAGVSRGLLTCARALVLHTLSGRAAGSLTPIASRTYRPPLAPRAPEAIETFLVRFEKAAQVEVRAMLAVPFLQLLELWILSERGHGESSRVHRMGREPRRKEGGRRASSPSLWAAVFMAQAPGPAPPRPADPAPEIRPGNFASSTALGLCFSPCSMAASYAAALRPPHGSDSGTEAELPMP